MSLNISVHAQEKLTLQGQTGIALPFTDIRDFSYTGINHNITLGTGIGYYLTESKNTRARFDILGGKMSASNQNIAWDNQFFETSASIEYNIISLFDKDAKVRLNLRGGVGMAIFTARAIDRQTRLLVNEMPSNFQSQNAFEWGSFALLGANFAFPITERLALNFGYNHRFIFSQNLDAIPNSSDDTYGIVTMGFTASLKSGKNPKMVEVDPMFLNELKTKVSVYEEMEKDRESERISRVELQNEELKAQISALREAIDTIKSKKSASSINQVEAHDNGARLRSSSGQQTDSQFRVIIASVSSKKAAENFVNNSKHVDIENVDIIYIDNLNTFRVVYKSTKVFSEAQQALSEIKQYFSDAWIASF